MSFFRSEKVYQGRCVRTCLHRAPMSTPLNSFLITRNTSFTLGFFEGHTSLNICAFVAKRPQIPTPVFQNLAISLLRRVEINIRAKMGPNLYLLSWGCNGVFIGQASTYSTSGYIIDVDTFAKADFFLHFTKTFTSQIMYYLQNSMSK